MKMVDMKMKSEKSPSICCDEDSKPEYPWGLQINLGNEELEKIGMEKMPEIDTEFSMQIKVKVTSMSVNSSKGEEDRKRLELQITEMGMDTDKKAKKSKGRMY